jgi:DNA-directed RNA polymerase subunit RPC12/RpoP
MIFFKCDRCGQEFNPDRLFLDGKIIEKKSLLLPIKGAKEMIAEQPIVQQIHLCPTCVSKLRTWLEEKEK